MSRLILCCAVSCLMFTSSSPCRADDEEDRAVEHLEKLNGFVIRDMTQPDKPVVEVILAGKGVGFGSAKLPDKPTNKYNRGRVAANEDLKQLAALKKLIKLSLVSVDV